MSLKKTRKLKTITTGSVKAVGILLEKIAAGKIPITIARLTLGYCSKIEKFSITDSQNNVLYVHSNAIEASLQFMEMYLANIKKLREDNDIPITVDLSEMYETIVF